MLKHSLMNSWFSLTLCLPLKPPPFITIHCNTNKKRQFLQVSAFSYKKFIQFALDETKLQTYLVPSPLQGEWTVLGETISFLVVHVYSPFTCYENTHSIQHPPKSIINLNGVLFYWLSLALSKVMDFAASPEPEFDDVINQRDYREKYYKSLMPLGLKYAEILPWGGKLTSESSKFFSPIVIWTKFASSQYNYDILYSAFMDYYKAWLELMDNAVEEINASKIACNRESQHRYLSWRAEKDPGQGLLKKLIGETLAKDLVRNFLFHSIDELGSKSFLDYFPEY